MPKKITKAPNPSASQSAAGTPQGGVPAPQQPQQHAPSRAAPAKSTPLALPPILTDGLPLPQLVVFDLDYTLWPFWIDTHATPPLRAAPAPSSQALANDPAAAIHAGVTTAAVDELGEEFRFYADVPQILYFLPIAGIKLAVASRTTTPELARDLLRILHVPSAVAIGQAQARKGTYTETQASGGGQPQQQQKQQGLAGNAEGGAALGANGTTAKLSIGSTGTTATSDNNTTANPAQKPTGGATTLTKRDTRSRRALDFFDAGLEMYPRSKLWHMEMIQRRTEIPYEQMLFFDDESRNREVERLGVTMWLVRDGVTWAEVERGIRSWRTRKGLDKGA